MFAALGGIVLVAALGSDKYWTQISTIAHPEGDYNWTDPVGRKAVWERGLGYVEQHPLVGVGVKAYPIAEGTLSDIGRSLSAQGKGFKWSVAHNSFLETAAELGIPGLIVFVAFFVVAIRTLMRVKPGRRYGPWISTRETAIAQMLVGALVGFAVAGIFVSAEYFSYLYFLLGLVIGFDKILRLRRDAAWAALAATGRPVRLATAPPPAAVPGAALALPSV
jgi:O-antigen ligase